MQAENLQSVRNALINRAYPIKYKIVRDISCKFTFTPEISPVDLSSLFQYASKVIELYDSIGTPIPIRNIPAPLFFEILHNYVVFQNDTGISLYKDIEEYSETKDSRNIWSMLNIVGKDTILQGEWDNIRNFWSVLNLNLDKQDKWDMVKIVFEGLQPWLNHDLYKKVKEHERTSRSDEIADFDPVLAEKMQEAALAAYRKKQSSNRKPQLVNLDELDDITIEESSNGR